MKSSIHIAPTKYLENISTMFRKLYSDEKLADVTLFCRDGSIKAHKIVLATCSPYFHRIFTENKREHPYLIMHGVKFQTLNNLIELIYKGNVDVFPEALKSLYELAGEFQLAGLSGILRNDDVENGKDDDDDSLNEDSMNDSTDSQRGVKRAAMDYLGLERNSSKKSTTTKDFTKFEEGLLKSTIFGEKKAEEPKVKKENETVINTKSKEKENSNDNEEPKLSAWAKKQRKFQCNLCPSSFKRSSHLIRHQLVHTGERPFACDQCDKAFSRHDKLKHHIRKAHEMGYVDYSMEMMGSHSSSPLPFVISHVEPVDADIDPESREPTPTPTPPKRPRGRPRKYPPGQSPIELKPPGIKRGRGRPRLNPVRQEVEARQQNYDITNLPFGDLEYLTNSCVESGIMEPLVQIETENNAPKETNTPSEEKDKKTDESLISEDKVEKQEEKPGKVENEGKDKIEVIDGGADKQNDLIKVKELQQKPELKEEEVEEVEEAEEAEEAEEVEEVEEVEEIEEVEVVGDSAPAATSNLQVLENKIAQIGECTISVANH